MTKITDLEGDVAQFKAATVDRLAQLETGLDAIREDFRKATSDADKRHAEIMALLLRPSQPSAAPAAPPITSQPLTLTAPLTTLPITIIPTAPPTGSSAPFTSLPPHAGQIPTAPFTFSSPLAFDEFGFPLSTTGVNASFSEVNSFVSGSYGVPPHREPPVSRPMMTAAGSYGGLHGSGSYSGLHGSGYPENRVWVPGSDYRLRKLKMPLFEGDDVYGWLYRVERFFEIQGLVTTGEKLRAAVHRGFHTCLVSLE